MKIFQTQAHTQPEARAKTAAIPTAIAPSPILDALARSLTLKFIHLRGK